MVQKCLKQKKMTKFEFFKVGENYSWSNKSKIYKDAVIQEQFLRWINNLMPDLPVLVLIILFLVKMCHLLVSSLNFSLGSQICGI